MDFDEEALSTFEAFAAIIAESLEQDGSPRSAALAILNSDRFIELIDTAYGDGLRDGLDVPE